MSVLPDAAARPSPAPDPPGPARPGLRERKKARTRAAIREHALALFREQGYDATTVEQIAEAAEVSPSTFFRYFPAKEDVVLQDDMELLWIEALRAQPPGLSTVTAVLASLRDAFGNMSAEDMAKLSETTALTLTVPAVRARMLDELSRTSQVLSAAIAERAGRPADDEEVVTLTGAILGVAMAAWFAAPGDLASFAQRYERGLAHLESGFTL